MKENKNHKAKKKSSKSKKSKQSKKSSMSPNEIIVKGLSKKGMSVKSIIKKKNKKND